MDAPDPMATVRGLEAFTGRGAGSDAERRAANWLAGQFSAAGHTVRVDTFWCRPNWALAHLWHAALAVGGSLITLASPSAAIVLLAIALVSILADGVTGVSLGRRLTPERASQNVVVSFDGQPGNARPVTLLLTANYDAGHIGLGYRLRPTTARLRQAVAGLTPGWLGWFSLAVMWLLGVAILRQTGHTTKVVGAIQLVPTAGLLLAFALLLELATGSWSPAAGDNASGVAVVLQVAGSLAAAAPNHLRTEVVLTGAGEAEQIGLRRHLRAGRQRRARRLERYWPSARRTADTIVLGVAACGSGTPRWWQSDGSLLPLRYSTTLERFARRVAEDEPHLQARPHRGRGITSAFPARMAGIPALTVGCLDQRGQVPRSHSKYDLTAGVDLQAIDRAAQLALLIIDSIDASLGNTVRAATATPA